MATQDVIGANGVEKRRCVVGICVKLAAVVAIVGLGLAATVSLAAPTALAVSNCNADGSIDSEEEEFLRLINDYRRENGVAALALSDTLNRAAAWKSQDMASRGYFAHDDLQTGRTFDQRIADCGYTFNTWLGENIAAGSETAAATFERWRNSPGHNANMLGNDYTAIGIGRAYSAGSPYGWYWTADFGGVADGHTAPARPGQPVGNVGCDGIVNSVDAAIILQRDAGLIGSSVCVDADDVNGDGMVNPIDAQLILQYDAGLIPSLAQ